MTYNSVTGYPFNDDKAAGYGAETPAERPADAPAWNCVSYPNEGMHCTNKDGDCRWCGKTKADIKRELDALLNKL